MTPQFIAGKSVLGMSWNRFNGLPKKRIRETVETVPEVKGASCPALKRWVMN